MLLRGLLIINKTIKKYVVLIDFSRKKVSLSNLKGILKFSFHRISENDLAYSSWYIIVIMNDQPILKNIPQRKAFFENDLKLYLKRFTLIYRLNPSHQVHI